MDQEDNDSFKMPLTQGSSDMLPLSEVSHILGEQTQYVSRYHTGAGGTKILTQGLRVIEPGPGGDYHAIKVAREDIPTLVARIAEHRLIEGAVTKDELEPVRLRSRQWVDENWKSFSGTDGAEELHALQARYWAQKAA